MSTTEQHVELGTLQNIHYFSIEHHHCIFLTYWHCNNPTYCVLHFCEEEDKSSNASTIAIWHMSLVLAV